MMTSAYILRPLAKILACAVLVGVVACDDAAPPPEPAAEPKPPAPKPAPAEPAPEPEPEPIAMPRPTTLASLDAVIEAATEIYAEHRRTFYCDCSYTPQRRVARGTCGYKTRADESLAKRIAWDRVVPNRAFGQHRACWRTPMCSDDAGVQFSGVRCCRETDEEFAAMELDLHNFVPAVGELQEDRSDFDFGEIEREPRMYGACDFEVDRGLQRAEPREDVRGDIARTYLYMHETYGEGLPLTAAEIERFQQWNTEDPADAWEVQRNKRIAGLQGIANSFVPMIAPAGAEEPDAASAKMDAAEPEPDPTDAQPSADAKPAKRDAPDASAEEAKPKAADATPEASADAADAKPEAAEANPEASVEEAKPTAAEADENAAG
ncbi:MAG: endonuclease [Myxococcota bacterium]